MIVGAGPGLPNPDLPTKATKWGFRPLETQPSSWLAGGRTIAVSSGCEDDSFFQPGMVLCAESYRGQRGAPFGIKYTEQFLITENGCEVLSKFPLDAMLA